MTKRTSMISAVAIVAAFVVPAISFAQAPNAIVHDSRNNQIKDIRGNCVRTLYGVKGEECGMTVEKAHTRLASVYFDFNKSDLNKKGKASLDKLLATLKHKKIHAVTIAGYADAIGSDSYNMQLSKKRAETVKKYLNAHGFKHTNVDMRAFGKSNAEAACKGLKDGKLHACMQEDRRVDIELSVTK